VRVSTPAPHGRADIRIGGGRSAYLGLAACAAFVIFGIALTAAPHANVGDKVVGVLAIALFGPLPLYGTVKLLRAGSLYVLASDGIRSPFHGWPLIPWADVQGTRIVTHRGRRYLAVDVRDAASRLRQIKSGSRAARRNVRTGLGFISIPEMLAPAGLEELQAEIQRRRVPDATPSAAAPRITGTSILPMSGAGVGTPIREAPPGSARRLRNIAAIHALLLVLALLAHRAARTPHVVVLGIAFALLLGALAAHFEALIVGLVTVLAAEALLVVVDLSVGHHIAFATRVLYLVFPLCVVLTAAQVWPRRTARYD
jgi:hypothetical protein